MKAKRIITLVITSAAVLMVGLSGIMKLIGGEQITTVLTKMGVADYVILLGLMEITFAALFAFPKTMRLGFILLSCYFAGALATELSHASPFNALIPMVLVWIAAFLRDKSIFLPAGKVAIT